MGPAPDHYPINRAHLLKRDPHLAEALPAEPPPPDACILQRDGGSTLPPDLPDVSGAAAGGSILVHGVPAPKLLAHLLALAGPHGYRPPVDIIEPDAVVLATWLRFVEPALIDPGLIGDERLTIFAGLRAGEDYARFRAKHLARRDPSHVLRCPRPGWTPARGDDDPGRRASRAAAARRGALLARQNAFYDDNTPASCAARFRHSRDAGASLRVLGLTTRYSTVVRYGMRNLAEAFRRRGWVFDLVTEPDQNSNDVDAWSPLASGAYDLVILVNALREQFGDRLHPRVPCAAWIQDHVAPLARRSAGRSIGPFDRVLCPRPWSLATRFEYPTERMVATSNVTGGDPFVAAPPTSCELAPWRCDVVYVSHASAPVERLVAELAAPKGAGFRGYLERIVAGLRDAGARCPQGIPFDVKLAIALEAESASPGVRLTPAERAAAIVPLVDVLADRIFRHEALAWAADWARSRGRDFRLYGAGWERHPTLAAHARGVIESGRPLACLSRAAAVNLQINGYGSLHQRLLDAIAAGGFVLSRANNADFIREPMTALAAYVADEKVRDLAGLLARAGRDPRLDDLLARFRKLGLFAVASAADPARRREDRLLREVYDFPAELLTDEARFEAIRTVAPAPHRVAGDLPGFADLTFDSAAALHALLDRYVDDPAAREAHAAPMRASVLGHDTADALVDRLVEAFCAEAS